MKFNKLYTSFWSDYELIDAGGGKKLERFGDVVTIRPELQAYFKSTFPFSGNDPSSWSKQAQAEFKDVSTTKGKWEINTQLPSNWNIDVLGLKVKLEFTQFKHVGIFPEQYANWKYIQSNLSKGERFLNLFAYTGIASLVACSAGAQVTHVDSVKQLVTWSKENMELSKLSDIRWIIDDALKFAQKEVKRGNKYDGIIMDPPAFGLGSKGEKWILDQKLPELLSTAKELLSDNGFLIVNTYSPKVTSSVLFELASQIFHGSKFEVQELWMKTKSDKELYFGNLLRVSNKR